MARLRAGQREQSLELGEFLRWRITSFESGGALELADERIQRAVGVVC